MRQLLLELLGWLGYLERPAVLLQLGARVLEPLGIMRYVHAGSTMLCDTISCRRLG